MKAFRSLSILSLGLFLAFTASGPALASGDHDGDRSMKDKWADFRMIQTERHKMITELMVITRDLTEILRNLNHRPSASEREALAGMAKKLDEMLEHDKEISRKMAHKWKKNWSDDPGKKRDWERKRDHDDRD